HPAGRSCCCCGRGPRAGAAWSYAAAVQQLETPEPRDTPHDLRLRLLPEGRTPAIPFFVDIIPNGHRPLPKNHSICLFCFVFFCFVDSCFVSTTASKLTRCQGNKKLTSCVLPTRQRMYDQISLWGH